MVVRLFFIFIDVYNVNKCTPIKKYKKSNVPKTIFMLKLIIVGNKRREIMLRFMLILFPQNNRFLESKFRNCEHLTMTHLIFKSIMATGFHI